MCGAHVTRSSGRLWGKNNRWDRRSWRLVYRADAAFHGRQNGLTRTGTCLFGFACSLFEQRTELGPAGGLRVTQSDSHCSPMWVRVHREWSLFAQDRDATLTLIHGLVLVMWARGNMTRLGVLPADLGSQQPVESVGLQWLTTHQLAWELRLAVVEARRTRTNVVAL